MLRRSASPILVLLVVICFMLQCKLPQDPTDPSNTRVELLLRNSRGLQSNSSITDTVDNPIRIGLAFYLTSYIDSIKFSVKVEGKAIYDTILRSFSTQIIDTIWKSMSFPDPGYKLVTIVPYAREVTLLPVSADITIVKKSSTIQPENHPPKWTEDTLTVALNDTTRYELDLSTKCTDPDNDKLRYTISGSVLSGDTIIDSLYVFQASPAVIGRNSIEITASDPSGLKDIIQLVLIVTASGTDAKGFAVAYNGNENSSGTIPIDTGRYATGSTVSVKGNTGNLLKTGYVFAGWNTVADGSGTAYAVGSTFTMGTGNVTLFARWTKNPVFTVTYDGNTSTTGIVPSDSGKYETGSPVTVKGNTGNLVKTGYVFAGWNTVADGSGTAYAVGSAFTMGTGNVTLFARWTKNTTFTLTITSTNGQVALSPNATVFDSGTIVTLTPVPSSNYHFSGWSGAMSGTANPATITMNSAKSVVANFEANPPNTFTLTVLAPNGTVQKTPDQTQYDSGSVITLTAVPNAGYQFTGWSGGITGTTNPSSVTMNAAKSVTANFTLKTYALSVTATNGSVTKSPDANSFDSGTIVTLTAVPNAGYQFTGWSGGITGTTNPSSVTMNAAKSVTANFALKTYALTVTATNGSVTKSPDANSYDSGAVVTLTAVPNAGYQFTEWSGGITGTTNPSSVTMSAAKSVTANFSLITYTLTYKGNGNSSGSEPSSINGIVSGASVTVAGVGSLVRDGFEFLGWNTDASATTAQYNSSKPAIVITANTTLYAIWKSLPTYTVTYNANGGGATVLFGSGIVPVDENVYTKGKNVTILDNPGKLKRTGYVFRGWCLNANDTNTIASYEMGSANVTFYARWAIMDASGNVYTEVKIGDQVWMVQNLKTTKLNNGTPLANCVDGKPSYVTSTYGALYNGWCYKDDTRYLLAPDGWRAADGNDWSVLFNYIVFGYYKLASKEYWQEPPIENDWGIGHDAFNNNGTGFTAYPDGYGSINGNGEYEYSGLTRAAGFWTNYSEYWGEVFYMSFEESGRTFDKVYDNMFYSVRCVRTY